MLLAIDASKGLDIILHTPGGDLAATESLIDYLNQKFDSDMRAIIPQLAMSDGTIVAFACKEIWVGKQSSLGHRSTDRWIACLGNCLRILSCTQRDQTRSKQDEHLGTHNLRIPSLAD